MTTNEARSRTRRAAAAAVLAASAVAPAWGIGLRTQFGEIRVRNLSIGGTYSLHKLLNMPLSVTNTSDDAVDLRMDVLLPQPQSLREGYEAVPSSSWVRLDKQEHLGIEPNAQAVSDVVLSIPDDDSLLGRRFQVHFWTRMVNRAGIGAGLEGILIFDLASERAGSLEELQETVSRRLANVNFTMIPNHGYADDVPLGQLVDLKEHAGLSIKLVNPNDAKVTFRLVARHPDEAGLSLIQGYARPPNSRWVSFEKELLEVEANSIGEARMRVEIPDIPHFRGQSWMFVVSAAVLEQEIPVYYSYRLLVTTRRPEAKDAKESETGAAGTEEK